MSCKPYVSWHPKLYQRRGCRNCYYLIIKVDVGLSEHHWDVKYTNKVGSDSHMDKWIVGSSYMPGTCKEFLHVYRIWSPGDKTRCQANSRAGCSRKGCGIRQPECQLCVSLHYTRAYTQVTKQLPVLVLFLEECGWLIWRVLMKILKLIHLEGVCYYFLTNGKTMV